jgi:uncharacterized protein (TIGR00369 family)
VVEDQSHARTYEWLEPVELAATAGPLSGEQYLEAWTGGELTPPMAATLGFGLTDFGEGHVEIRCTPDEYHYNPYGTVHGGLAATLLDSATGCAIQSRLPAGTGYATLNLAVSYLRPITTGTGEIRCIGKVVSMGRTVAVSEADLLDGPGKTLARATATCLLINANPT